MRQYSIVGMTLLVPAFLLLTAVSGCGKKTTDATSPVASPSPSPSPSPAAKKDPVAGELAGVLKGTIKFDGTFKAEATPEGLAKDPKCLEGAKAYETIGQRWIVSDKGEVANAVVYLKPPKGKYFKFDPDKHKIEDVFMDQPHCAFDPHVVVLFPTYFDGTKQIETKQKFVVKNSATFAHNYKVYQVRGPDINKPIPPKTDSDPILVRASYEDPANISCQQHTWMTATAWGFDHPYAARTGMDGSYEIRNIPTGVDLEVVVWHEGITPKKETKNFGKDPIDYSVSVKPK